MALRRIALILLALIFGGSGVRAASADENRAYKAATDAFNDTIWGQAEAQFARFVTEYPQSERVPEAVLLQAQAQFRQGKYAPAVALLTARLAGAGNLTDQYLCWIGEAQFQSADFTSAAETFGRVVREFPASPRRVEAVIGEAAARARLGEWSRVEELLQNPAGAFQQAAAQSRNELVARGRLLLAESGLVQKKFPAVEAALQPLEGQSLKPELEWQKNFLRIKTRLAAGEPQAALDSNTNLMALAQATGRRDWVAESADVQARILEQLGRADEAMAAYQENLADAAPPAHRRQALLKIIELSLARNRPAETIQKLEQFLTQHPNDSAADLALLSLGELNLKLHVTAGPTNGPATNHWLAAMQYFDRLINTFSNSPLIGKAELGRGWCHWISNQMPESAAAFLRAAERLAPSEDQAIARFKLADALFAQKDFVGAHQYYLAALDLFARWPRLDAALRAPALYQALRASCATTNVAGAEAALDQILRLPAGGGVADGGVLLVGQTYMDAGQPEQARTVYEQFLATIPNSARRPEVELAIAVTREQQGDWPGAIAAYEQWLARFGTNTLRPRAEFQRAWATYQAGQETNALALFMDFVTRHPTNDLAPQAQWWVADYYYRQPDGFLSAEKNYKLLFLNWPGSELAYEARMMAGRAAVRWSGYANAMDHFTNLTSDLKCPPGLRAQALFAYGNMLMAMPSAETNRLANYTEAVRVFQTLQQEYPTNEVSLLAWGEIGKCHFQLGDYPAASNAFARVIASSAGVAARSEAQVGLGMVLEAMAVRKTGDEQQTLLQQALAAYLPVLYEENLREGETPAAFWVKESGLKAARVVETLGEWRQAERLYRRLQDLLPPLRVSLETRIKRALERAAEPK